MAVYGAELPEGFTLDEPQDQQYGSELPEGFTLDPEPQAQVQPIEQPIAQPDPMAPLMQKLASGEKFTPRQNEALAELIKRGKISGESFSTMGIPGSRAIGESQGSRGLTREAMPVLRPTLEAGASVAGALIAAPTTPVGQAAAGALGYGIGKKAADIIEGWTQNRKDERPQPETLAGQFKRFGKDVGRETMQSAKDVAFGATMEMGGQLAVKGITASAKFAMNKLKDIGKALPPLTKAGATQRAGQVLAAQTKDGPLVAQNIAEAEALEEAIPGLKFRRGQLTNDPGVIKFERAQARMTGDAAQEQLEQEARNSKAIRDFMDEQKGAGGIEDVIDPLAQQEKAVATGAEAAAGRLEQEGAQLGGGMGAVETGETIRAAARAGKTAAQKEGGELFKDVPEFPIDANRLISKIDELSTPLNEFEMVGKNVPEEFGFIKEILAKRKGITTPQGLQGLRGNLTDALRDAQGAANPNNRVISRLSQLVGEVDTVLKEAGETAKQGDFATYQGKVIHPKKIQSQLDEIDVKLEKEGYGPPKEVEPYKGEHSAPDIDGGVTADDMTGDIYPDDIYSNKALQYYGTGNDAMDRKTISIFNKLKGKPNAKVKIYRAVPEEYKNTQIQEGDWVSINKDYAIDHGESALNGKYTIIETEARAGEIATDGNSFHEWGYWPKEAPKPIQAGGLAEAKPDIKKIVIALEGQGKIGTMRQTAETAEDYSKRIVNQYKKTFGKDAPTLKAKEKPMVAYLKEKKAILETQLAGAEAATPEVKTAAAGQLKTAQQFWKKEVIEKFKSGTTGDILRKGKGGDKVSNAQIASRYFKPGSAGVEQANQFVESVGDNPQAREAIEDFIKQDLLSTATNPVTGDIIESKLKTWLTRYKPSLKKLGLENRFNTMVKASEELNKAKDMQVAFNKSVASKALNSDVDSVVKSVFATGSKRKAAERLMGQLKGDKKAIAGIQNATIDHLITNAEATAVDAFNNPIVSLAGVEREFKKLKPAIDVVFKSSPQKLKALNSYRRALKIMQRGKASPLGGGSDTAENVITAMSKASGLTHSRILNILKSLAKPLLDMSDNQVNAILNRAAFDPEFAQTIMMASKGRPVKIIEQRLQSHLAALGLRETNLYDKAESGSQKVIDVFK